MGNFYVNFSARGVDAEAIADVLRSQKRNAYVSPTVGEITVFYDSEADKQNGSEITNLGRNISASLRCPVLAVLNHDDDIL